MWRHGIFYIWWQGKRNIRIYKNDNRKVIKITEEKKEKRVFDPTEWKDIDHELYRTYIFSEGKEVTIETPTLIHVSKSGGHRILDEDGVSHYIPPKWIHLFWETKDDVAFRF